MRLHLTCFLGLTQSSCPFVAVVVQFPDLYCSIAAAANSRLNYIIEVDFPAQKLLIKLQFTIPSQVPEMFDPDFGNITIYVV